jgi:hypothetical protein
MSSNSAGSHSTKNVCFIISFIFWQHLYVEVSGNRAAGSRSVREIEARLLRLRATGVKEEGKRERETELERARKRRQGGMMSNKGV